MRSAKRLSEPVAIAKSYALVTQTDRFKAAISSCGPSDLISMYGTFPGAGRYSEMDYPNVHFSIFLSEYGAGRMGNPPWKDWARYLRNSPLFYVERVQTPPLIMQGDLDGVPLQQSEEFFTALYRQGKRARYLRYWAEDHGVGQPANTLDCWHEVYAWLDEFSDVSRNEKGDLIFEGDRVKSRQGAPAWKPADYARFD